MTWSGRVYRRWPLPLGFVVKGIGPKKEKKNGGKIRPRIQRSHSVFLRFPGIRKKKIQKITVKKCLSDPAPKKQKTRQTKKEEEGKKKRSYTILEFVSEEKCPRFCFCRRPLLFFGHFLQRHRNIFWVFAAEYQLWPLGVTRREHIYEVLFSVFTPNNSSHVLHQNRSMKSLGTSGHEKTSRLTRSCECLR